MKTYGNDKPDIRFGMEFGELNEVTQHKEFPVFNAAELVVGIAAPGVGNHTRKEIDALIDWVKRPQVGASGMVYVKCNEDGTFKSSVDKFFDENTLKSWAEKCNAKPGDLILIMAGNADKTRTQLSGRPFPGRWWSLLPRCQGRQVRRCVVPLLRRSQIGRAHV